MAILHAARCTLHVARCMLHVACLRDPATADSLPCSTRFFRTSQGYLRDPKAGDSRATLAAAINKRQSTTNPHVETAGTTWMQLGVSS